MEKQVCTSTLNVLKRTPANKSDTVCVTWAVEGVIALPRGALRSLAFSLFRALYIVC